MSEALRLMLRPGPEYSARVAASRGASWARALTVPGLLTLLFGIVTSVAATGRVVGSIIASQALCWSFVPALQFVAGSMLIASASGRPVTFPRAMELLFAAHGPWSLWLVAMAAMQMAFPSQVAVLLTFIVPAVWTAVILSAFGREVLGLSATAARRRVLAHQLATLVLILVYIEFATRLSVRLIGAFQ